MSRTWRRIALALGLTALTALVTCSAAAAISVADKPNLYIQLPHQPRSDQVAPVYVDAYQLRGHLLFRFDAVISNRGGALDLYRDVASGHAMQAIWPGGRPTEKPDPNRAPGGDAILEDRSSEGGAFEYVTSSSSETDGHNHWHFLASARYELLVPGGGRVQPKVGFCMYDSWGGADYFRPKYEGVGPNTWCAPNTSGSSFVRMGLSPSASDNYFAQVPLQWIDVTDLAPGPYSLRAIANPRGAIDESNASDNTLVVQRIVPGTTARSFAVDVTAGEAHELRLSGTVVGASIPARKSSTCRPSRSSLACYLFAAPDGPLRFTIETPPAHGTLELRRSDRLEAVALYSPAPGFSGTDSFTYTTTDARNLTSRLATVVLDVRPNAPTNVLPPTISGDVAVGSALAATTGTWTSSAPLDYSFEWRRCASAGAACAPIGGATTSTYIVSPSDVGSRLLVVVTASNPSGLAEASSPATDDAFVRAPFLMRRGAFLAASVRVGLSWGVEANSLDWLASYDLRYFSIRPDGRRTRLGSWLEATTQTAATFAGVPGRTYCFAARTRDTLGNTSDWSAGECRALPLDDRALERRSSWRSASARDAYRRTLSISTKAGSMLTRTDVRTRTIALLVTRCPRCGVVTVLFKGRRLGRVSLASEARETRQLVPIADFRRLRSGTVAIRVVSRRLPVPIDGLVTSRRRPD